MSVERDPSLGRPDRRWSLDDFDIGRKIGTGRFGKVYLAREKESKCAVALKVLSKELIARYDLQHQIRRECELHYYLRQRNIVRLLAFFWDAERIFLVLEYCEGGNLYQFLKSHPTGRLSEPEAARYVKNIADGLAYCHAHGIMHRDIKPENILLKKGRAKLSDFTWAVQCEPSERRRTLCGTLDYLSPELIACGSRSPDRCDSDEASPDGRGPNRSNTHFSAPGGYGFASDVWSLGCILYELVVGRPPFERPKAADTCRAISTAELSFPSGLAITTQCKNLILGMVKANPEDRLTAQQVVEHPWFAATVEDQKSGYPSQENGRTSGGKDRFCVPSCASSERSGLFPLPQNASASPRSPVPVQPLAPTTCSGSRETEKLLPSPSKQNGAHSDLDIDCSAITGENDAPMARSLMLHFANADPRKDSAVGVSQIQNSNITGVTASTQVLVDVSSTSAGTESANSDRTHTAEPSKEHIGRSTNEISAEYRAVCEPDLSQSFIHDPDLSAIF